MEANHFPIPTTYYPEQKEERRNGWVVSWFSLQFYYGVSVSGEERAKQHLQITLYEKGNKSGRGKGLTKTEQVDDKTKGELDALRISNNNKANKICQDIQNESILSSSL